VGVFVHQRAINRAKILCPLLLDMDQRPTPSAEMKVL